MDGVNKVATAKHDHGENRVLAIRLLLPSCRQVGTNIWKKRVHLISTADPGTEKTLYTGAQEAMTVASAY